MRYLIVFLIFICHSMVHASGGMWPIPAKYYTTSSGPPTTVCVGWANTLCVPDAEPLSSVILSTDRSWFRHSWTATESGTVRAVHFKSGDSTNNQNYIGLGVYRNVSGTWTRICHGDEITDLASNTWYRTATAIGTCTFSAGDELRFGISVDYTSSFSFRRGVNTSNAAYYQADAISGAPPATATMTTSGSQYDLAFMMEYTND